MKIAVLSATRLPTSPTFPGNGLGYIALATADGLRRRGHEVTLYAGENSRFDGDIIIENDERGFLRHNLLVYDAVLDHTHGHVTQAIAGLPAAQISHDREVRPTANAVFPTEAHRRWWEFPPEKARVIRHGVLDPGIEALPKGEGYAAFLGTFWRQKGVVMAVQAAKLAGIPLLLVGTTPPAPPGGARYLGPLWGVDKTRFLQRADVLLFPASTESAGLVPLEAAMVGTPSVVSAYGGAPEQIVEGETGYTARDVLEMAEKIEAARALNRSAIQAWARRERNLEQMIDAYEALVQALAGGERW